jgi:penicillin amidase
MIEPFAAGINYYIYTHWSSIPSWIQANAPVTGNMIASMGALINFLFSNQVLTKWGTAQATIDAIGVTAYLNTFQSAASDPPSPSVGNLSNSTMGSNEWTVYGTLSATGVPMLGTNPHLDWDGVTQWHEAQLTAPAENGLPALNIYGVIFYGLPFIGIGHNDYLSWMSTVDQPDLGDVWIEQLSPDNTMYLYQGAWVPLTVETVNLPVLVSGTIVNVPITTDYTDHGALLTVNTTDHWALAVNYTSNQNVIGFEQFYLMDTAQNITQFNQALSMLGVAMFNYMVASVYNETYYVWNAICPIRNSAYDWDYAVPGWESSTDWGGPIPFVSLPQSNGSATGWMQNCNIPCWNITVQPNQITLENATNPFPEYLVDWYNSTSGTYEGMSNFTRGYNLFEILNSSTSISFNDMLGIIGNASVPYLAAAYINQLPATDPYPPLNSSIQQLSAWLASGAYAWANQTAMTIFQLWVQNTYPNVPSSTAQADSTLNSTVAYMLATYGSVTVPWGSVHIDIRGSDVIPMNGTDGEPYGCLNPHYAQFDPTTGIWYCYGGSSFMMVTNLQLGNVTSWSCLPYGDSNNPSSPHFDDMLKDYYSQDILHPDFFYASDIQNVNNQDPTLHNYTVSVYTLSDTIGMINQILLMPLIQGIINLVLLLIASAQLASQSLTIDAVLIGFSILVAVVALVVSFRRP